MLYGRTYDMEREAMPQTVPSAGQSPPSTPYTFTADSFDLSLLSPDGEVPVSPPSLRHLVTLLGDPTTEPMFGACDEDDCIKNKDSNLQDFDFPTTILEDNIPQLKSMPAFKTEPQRSNLYQNDPNTLLFEQFHNFGYQSPVYPTPSPSSDEGSIPTFSIQPCSPYDTSNLSYSSPNSYSPYLTIKQEPNNLLSPGYSGSSPYPHSPASTCTSYSNHSSPHYNQPVSPSQFSSTVIKDEAAIDIEEFLKENQILQDSIYSHQKAQSENQAQPTYENLVVPKTEPFAKPIDHQLLREVLQDTSFQKKYNLRPLNLDILTSSFTPFTNLTVKMEEPDGMSSSSDTLMTSCSSVLAREKIEPVLSLAIEQMRKDVDNTCSALGISPDPVQWSGEDVKAWLLWTLRQYSLPLVPMEYFCMDGAKLAALSEQDFVQRAPQAGSTLYAQLEIWKVSRQESSGNTASGWGDATPSVSTLSSNEEASDEEDEDMAVAGNGTPSPGSSGVTKAPTKGGSHIHLWQFLKELLASPQLHGSAIRWLDRGKGVFKIEDSVRVARLWGKRKNRPAMNYDKLSRSIRQYYKKGIMKKTERSQRLVYQFCHPYCL